MLRVPTHQVGHQRLWHTGVDVVVGHLICVKSRPAKSQFTKIACAHNDATDLISMVEQDLRALTGLGVFKDNIVLASMRKIRQMLRYCGLNRNLLQRYSSGLG